MFLRLIKRCIPEQLKAAVFCSRQFKAEFGHYPNLFFPKTYNEKLQKYKVFIKGKEISRMQDKVLVKEHVKVLLGADYIIPTLWHGKRLPPISQRNWPIPFVIKANHASGWNLFVRTPQACHWDEIEEKCNLWMSHQYGRDLGEWSYGEIEPQLLIEPFISDFANFPIDYKIWVFNGKAKIIQVIIDRDTVNVRQAFYDLDWNRLSFNGKMINGAKDDFVKPVSMNKILEASELLGRDFQFVRVDFYEINNKPLFGEMTFYPASGYSAFEPEEWDLKIGKMWR